MQARTCSCASFLSIDMYDTPRLTAPMIPPTVPTTPLTVFDASEPTPTARPPMTSAGESRALEVGMDTKSSTPVRRWRYSEPTLPSVSAEPSNARS